MKRAIIAVAALIAASALAFAQPAMMGGAGMMPGRPGAEPGAVPGGLFAGPYLATELAALKTELGDRPFGELTVNQLAPYWNRLETAMRKDAWVRSSAMLSMMMPGSGQFRNGDTGGGVAFLALNLGAAAGTLVGFYYLLPADLRFDRLDYLSSSFKTINDSWNAHSLNDYLPSIGVLAAGALVDAGIRFWSARSAWSDAKAGVDAGTVKFEPQIGPGFFGMGMRF